MEDSGKTISTITVLENDPRWFGQYQMQATNTYGTAEASVNLTYIPGKYHKLIDMIVIFCLGPILEHGLLHQLCTFEACISLFFFFSTESQERTISPDNPAATQSTITEQSTDTACSHMPMFLSISASIALSFMLYVS